MCQSITDSLATSYEWEHLFVFWNNVKLPDVKAVDSFTNNYMATTNY